MAEQVDLALLSAPSRRATACDAEFSRSMQWMIRSSLEGRKRPVDRRPRRLDRIALAAKFLRNAPADFKTRPARRTPRPDPSGEFAARLFLDHEHADAVQRPMSGHDRRVAPADQRLGDGLAVGSDEARAQGSAEHRHIGAMSAARHCRRISRSVSMPGPVGLRQRDAGFERRDIILPDYVMPGLSPRARDERIAILETSNFC